MGIEYLWNVYNTVNEWIRFSDAKAGAILAAIGIIASISLPNIYEIYQNITNDVILLLLVILAAIFCLISVVYSIKCLDPSKKSTSPVTHIYFGHIAEEYKSYDEFSKSIVEFLPNNEKIQNELSCQIWTNSIIAYEKFKNVKWAIRFFSLSTITILITICVSLVLN